VVEVKETLGDDDIERFASLVKYVGARRRVIVTSNQDVKREDVEVIPVYLTEFGRFAKKT